MCIKSTDKQYGSIFFVDFSVKKLRTIRLVPIVEEEGLYWNLFCTDCKCSILHCEVHPRDLKDILHLLPELVNQHYMTFVCFIAD